MNEHLDTLEPVKLWQHFKTFCQVPRPSFHEQAIMAAIKDWAEQKGLAYEQDDAGNLRIIQPATRGLESAPGIVLQGHVDMVSEAAVGVDHDFENDPIETFVKEGWLKAKGTTLGADNGVGAAAALAILDEDIAHGPLEVLLTVSEEVSLVGAANLKPNWLQGQWLLNLDSEAFGEVTMGCAGGANVATDTKLAEQIVVDGEVALDVVVDGLTGGHSGLDIATGRASANRLLARVLYQLRDFSPRLAAYDGGKMDNAITRTARATIVVADTAVPEIKAIVPRMQTLFKQELVGVDEGVSTFVGPTQVSKAATAEVSRRLIGLLYTLPFGPERMSLAAPGVVETSNNLGVLQVENGRFKAQLMVRSLVDSARNALVERIAEMFNLAGFEATIEQGYPGWTPDTNSDLLAKFVDIYAQSMGQKPKVEVLHAGLECGLIGAKYPQMDMISYGPTILGAHSPDERVDIQTVAEFYEVLKAAVAGLAKSA